ncbi:hypothetical protein HanRHA438_Chr02g0062721 [Helianthus annuus]|nr:hypothetical protein HanLR1_Chr02g0051621 [Helianthus annuus]KAJ0939576.1 hypothetical protein HanRHA438_Chr02g0062721 [Helianthus annuus]
MGENPNSTSKSVVSVTAEDIRLLHIYQPAGEGVMARGWERRPQRSKFVRIQFLNLDSKQLLVI